MSRSGYCDDLDLWGLIRWRGAVASAIRGKRGQEFLKEALAQLDAMPEKRLIAHELETSEGEYCTLGVVGKARDIDMANLYVEDPDEVSEVFGISGALTREIVYMNDEHMEYYNETPEQRWERMRKWIAEQIIQPAPADQAA